MDDGATPPAALLLPEEDARLARCYIARQTNRSACLRVLQAARTHPASDIFEEPVSEADVPGYRLVVTSPMWLGRILQELRGTGSRGLVRTVADFCRALNQVWRNCFLFNPAGHVLRDYATRIMTDVRREWDRRKDKFVATDDPGSEYCVVCGTGRTLEHSRFLRCHERATGRGCGQYWHTLCGSFDALVDDADEELLCPSCDRDGAWATRARARGPCQNRVFLCGVFVFVR